MKPDVPYYPTVGMKKPGEALRANFGQEPFAFDIDKMMQVRTIFPLVSILADII